MTTREAQKMVKKLEKFVRSKRRPAEITMSKSEQVKYRVALAILNDHFGQLMFAGIPIVDGKNEWKKS